MVLEYEEDIQEKQSCCGIDHLQGSKFHWSVDGGMIQMWIVIVKESLFKFLSDNLAEDGVSSRETIACISLKMEILQFLWKEEYFHANWTAF